MFIRMALCISANFQNRYIKDPSEAVKVGQIVKVQVLGADAKTKRIALSIKALQGPAPKNPPKAPRGEIRDKIGGSGGLAGGKVEAPLTSTEFPRRAGDCPIGGIAIQNCHSE